MFIHNLDPVAFSIGMLEIRWYGLAYVAGFLLGYYVLYRAAQAGKLKNLTPRRVEDYIFWLMLGGIIGGRLGEVLFFNLPYYVANPAEIIAVWHGGMSIHGGLIGGLAVTYWYAKKHKLRFYDIVDNLAWPLALALVFGRIANFINGELWGPITNVPWCVVFPTVGGCRHPSPLYEAGYSLVLFGILLLMSRKGIVEKLPTGTRFWTFIGLYGLFRFIANFWREPDYGVTLLGLQTGQWLSLVMVVLSALWYVARRPRSEGGRTGT
jgi:phosphatidylglycerol:prolipoprotein diacylglycerol transferase